MNGSYTDVPNGLGSRSKKDEVLIESLRRSIDKKNSYISELEKRLKS